MQEKTSTIIHAIIVISSIFILVAAFVVAYVLYFHKRKARFIQEQAILKKEFERQLFQSQAEVQESTFQHIAKELHDNVGQLLSYTKVLLGSARLSLADPPDSLNTAIGTLSTAIREMRSLSRSLDKDWLQQFDFKSNLESEIGRINAGGVIKASCACHAFIDMPPREQIILFRIVQEAIQNAIKHAGPSVIAVQVSETAGQLQLSIANDGAAMPAGFHGMGTNNMRQRTRLFGGDICWAARDGGGTTVYITLPATRSAYS